MLRLRAGWIKRILVTERYFINGRLEGASINRDVTKKNMSITNGIVRSKDEKIHLDFKM